METATIARVLIRRRILRRRERWTRARLLDHQAQELARLRSFAVRASPFYAHAHRGLMAAPLADLPPLTKANLMDNFDKISAVPAVRLHPVDQYLAGLADNRRYRGRYWVSATSGSSGRRSIIVNDPAEWATVIASYARANEWAGITAGPTRRVRMAVVSSTAVWHQSSRVAATVRSPFLRSERFDAAAPLDSILAGLNKLGPDVLVAYASMIRLLASEQLAGRLRITPRAVNASSEVLTTEARQLALRAWGVEPFNVYAATETGGIAADCPNHHRMHLFEDLVIPEVVDADYRPVPPGHPGDRLLVTVLFSRTLPLIRYELTDRIHLSADTCACGLPFAVINDIEGRTDDLLHLPGRDGSDVAIQPALFHRLLDLVDAAGWQVRHEPPRLRILLAAPDPALQQDTIAERVQGALRQAGADTIPVEISIVDTIPAGAAGKRPVVVAPRS